MVDNQITPIAYLSIGEAETYRFYWNPSWIHGGKSTGLKPWLGRENPDWPGNYKTRYWYPDWRTTVLAPYLDRIIEQGFHGVYLDIVDGYQYWSDISTYSSHETFKAGDPVYNEEQAARWMIDLVKWIAEYCRSRSPLGEAFYVIPQNAAPIIQYDYDGSYLDTISAIGIEDLWYWETTPRTNSEIETRLGFLSTYSAAGKPVYVVDYVDSGLPNDPDNIDRIQDYLEKCDAYGFNCYVARSDRELDNINTVGGKVLPVKKRMRDFSDDAIEDGLKSTERPLKHLH